MQDRFKFRVFVKNYCYVENGEYKYKPMMCKVHTLHLRTGKVIISCKWGNKSVKLNENNILMQCTGLKDKNGKLIFEGDIVKVPFLDPIFGDRITDCNSENAIVEFHKGCWTVRYADNSHRIYLYDYENECEIIGNIYENKELLESEV